MDAALLARFCPLQAPRWGRPDAWVEPFQIAIAEAALITPQRLQAFMAQVAHESAGFTALAEDLNYSASGLRLVFGRYFPTDDLADSYARRPEAIANRVYASRLGNGGESSGDGWRYRGRGLIHITGRRHYQSCSVALFRDLRLEPDPQLLQSYLYAARSAAWFWRAANLNAFADEGSPEAFTRLTKKINGGTNGLANRLEWWHRAQKIFV